MEEAIESKPIVQQVIDIAKQYKFYIAAAVAVLVILVIGLLVYTGYIKIPGMGSSSTEVDKSKSKDVEEAITGQDQKREISQLVDEINSKQ